MPERSGIQATVRAAFHRWPQLQRTALGALDVAYQVALLPFRRRRLRGREHEPSTLVERTDEYNKAAEAYFATFPDQQFLLDKPFSETHATARHLIDVGVLIDCMRLSPGDVVVELGAGTCWLSQMLNRYGCRTVAIDVSPTALALGREVFQRDPRTNWTLSPEFLTYDGYTLPLPDACCDRIVINDAFHHVPNQRALLTEMYRVLRADGVVAMSEPGAGHASAEHSRDESANTGVLENELVLEDLATLAAACGFSCVNVVVAGARARSEIPARELGAFMGGRYFAGYWKALCSNLEQHHYILCYKGAPEPTTRRPANLSAAIDVVHDDSAPMIESGQQSAVIIRVTNTGDTRWLGGGEPGSGWTRLGAHLYRDAEPRQLVDFDWLRIEFPGDVPPGAHLQITSTLPAIESAGTYLVVFDVVIEGVTWFASHGSRTATLQITVTGSTPPAR